MAVREYAEAVRRSIKDRKEHIAERISNGKCEDIVDYKSQCERIRAYQDVITIIEEELERYERS